MGRSQRRALLAGRTGRREKVWGVSGVERSPYGWNIRVKMEHELREISRALIIKAGDLVSMLFSLRFREEDTLFQ